MKGLQKLLWIIVAFIGLTAANQRICLAAEGSGKTLIVFIDYVNSEELFHVGLPSINKLTQTGAVGLMTLNTAGAVNLVNEYITLGAGVRARASSGADAFMHPWEKENQSARDLYKINTGKDAGEGSIINPNIPVLIRVNQDRGYTIIPGNLGSILRMNQIKTAFIGNSDYDSNKRRYAALSVMDNEGIIPYGNVDSKLLNTSAIRPYGISSNYAVMEDEIRKYLDMCQVVAVQLGDTYRAEEYKGHTELSKNYKTVIMKEVDGFVGRIMKNLNPRQDRLILISSLTPKADLSSGNRLAPIIMWGKGISRGWLTSTTTRRKGIITNLDIAPTVLHFYDIPIPYTMLGHYAFSSPASLRPEKMISLNQLLQSIYKQRPFLLKSFVFLQICILIFMTAAVNTSVTRKWIPYLQPILLCFMIIPLSFLLLPIFYPLQYLGFSAAVTMIITLIILLVLLRIFPNYHARIASLCLLLMTAVTLDVLFDAPLMKQSPLGYDVIGGARFYGIGNEYMGVLIVSTVVGMTGIVKKDKIKRLHLFGLIVIWTFEIFLIGSPAFGANLGGMMAAFITFGTAAVYLIRDKIGIKTFLYVGVTLPIVVAVLLFIDGQRAVSSQSHMGQAFRLIEQDGIRGVLGLITRKWTMNVKLIRYTIWSRVFLVSLAVITALFYRPIGIFKMVLDEKPILRKGLFASTIGCIAALLVNDSGVVAAALGMIYVVIPILLLVMDKIREVDMKNEKD